MEPFIKDDDCFQLAESTRDISNHVAGYIVHKGYKAFGSYYGSKFLLTTNETSTTSYTSILSRGGLKTEPEDLNDAVAKSFAILDATSSVIRSSEIPSIEAGLTILEKFVDVQRLTCDKHEEPFSKLVLRTVCNCFSNAQKKRSTESVADDHVRTFKQSKRNKDNS